GSTLISYLYGRSFAAFYDAAENLHVTSRRIQRHRWGFKTIDSGFFYLPNSEMISAVLQNSTATISKFNRIGMVAKLGSPHVKMLRFGTAYDHDQNAAIPRVFRQRIDDPN